MSDAALYWLPPASDWRATLAALRAEEDEAELWDALVAAARMRLDFVQTQQLDRLVQARFALAAPAKPKSTVRLAVLASSNVDQLMPSLRVGGLRHGLWVQTYTNAYGQYLQDLHDPQSEFYQFQPSTVLLALDARHVLGRPISAVGPSEGFDEAGRILDHLQGVWSLITENADATVMQQTFLPIFPPLVGENEQRLSSSAAAILSQVNHKLRERADASKVDLLSIDAKAAQLGLGAWYDPVLWHRAKQEVHPAAAPLYGELFARLEAAKQGRSSKCLVLDLDNTLWGGVIGDDGLDGITLGQGDALGEAHLELQNYALALSRRGVILAVCSKNDEEVALSAFKDHPEMALRPEHIAAFVANWDDKATNLRRVADDLGIGIDSLVFVDDNPFERNIVRRELPEVWVPELPDDAALYTSCLVDAGLFEAVHLTPEDFERSGQYQENRKREELRRSSTDLTGYLKSLSMELHWKRFDRVSLQRTVQLINKTNQFNLTTVRYSESEVVAVMDDPKAFGLQLRLLDHFGDNGIIAIVIGVPAGEHMIILDTWVMSCRVLGRQVEEATLNIVAQEARRLGAATLIGRFRPSGRNEMVRKHYEKLGFSALSNADAEDRWQLDLTQYTPDSTFIDVREST